jgi:VWFA-related protein
MRMTRPIRSGKRLASAAIALVALWPSPDARTAQQPPDQAPTFRSGTTLVELDVRVTDQNGGFVADLGPDDFDVYVDGRPCPIATFELTRHEAAKVPPPASPDVSSNERGGHEGRTYLLVLDDLQTHPLRTETVRAAARRFVRHALGPDDRAAVVRTSGREVGHQPFTSNRDRLDDAIDSFRGDRLPAAPAPAPLGGQPGAGADRHPAYPGLRNVNAEDADAAMIALKSLGNWVDWMSGLTGRRKVVVLFSEGVGYDTSDVFRNADAPLVELYIRDAIGAAARHNVAIYAIDVRGLPSGKPGPVATIPDEDFFSRDSLRAKHLLRALAAETGGFAMTNSNDFDVAFERIVQESSVYYLLGFVPPRSSPGTRHRIEVRANRPGVTVRSRRSYVSAPDATAGASSPALSSRLDALLRQPLPQSDLSMSVGATTLRTNDRDNTVVVTVEVSRGRHQAAAQTDDPVALRIVAATKDGQVRAARSMTVKPADGHAGPLRVVTRLSLRPGEYHLRAAAAAGGAEGTVHHDLIVADLRRKPIAMSGPALSTAATRAAPAAPSTDDMQGLLPIAPTPSRVFRSGDELLVFSRVYANERTPAGIEYLVRIDDETGRPLFTHRESVRASEMTDAGQPLLVHASLDFPPGPYVLVVEARSGGAREQSIVRQVPLRLVTEP